VRGRSGPGSVGRERVERSAGVLVLVQGALGGESAVVRWGWGGGSESAGVVKATGGRSTGMCVSESHRIHMGRNRRM
jgi:hypothetical protein